MSSFLSQFWKSTLENWQSEFLQLFSFVVLSAYFIQGQRRVKDSDEQMPKEPGSITT